MSGFVGRNANCNLTKVLSLHNKRTRYGSKNGLPDVAYYWDETFFFGQSLIQIYFAVENWSIILYIKNLSKIYLKLRSNFLKVSSILSKNK